MPNKPKIMKVPQIEEGSFEEGDYASVGLTANEWSLVNAYFTENMNQVRAYLKIHPDTSYNVAKVKSSQIFARPQVRAELTRRLRENAMPSEEVLYRLGEQARASHKAFIHIDDDGSIYFDFSHPDAKANIHLIKKIKTKRKRVRGKLKEEWVEVELHDSQKALELIGKYYKMFMEGEQKSTSNVSVLPSIPAELLAPSFLESWRAVKSGEWTEFIEKGGRGSTKSTFISLVIIWLIVNNPTFHALVMRQVADTLRQSVYAQLKWAINKLGLTDSFKCTVNPLEIEYLPTGQRIFMRGADDPFKIKSITPEFGSIAILWFEEISQFYGEDAIRDITQSAIRGENSDVAYIFKSYNPPRTQRNWINKYVLIPKANQYQHSSTYLDVPKQWLGKVFFDEAEHLKKVNPSAYDNEYLGIVNGLGDSVFENLEIREITDDEIKTFESIEEGLDFGYSPHPAHYAKTYYDADSMILYIFGEVRKWKASNREMYEFIVDEGGYENSRLLICDSAEDKSVADYQSYGAYAIGAEKGAGSVNYSMRWLQTRAKIVIDPARCPYSATEFSEYSYERTKNGELIEAYPKEKDDAIAATRYAQNLRWRIGGE